MGATPVRGTPQFPAITLAEGVVVTGSGFHVGGKTSGLAAGVSQTSTSVLMAAAQTLAPLDQNPFTRLTTAQKGKVEAHLTPFLLHFSQYRGRPSSVSIRSRSAAFALMVKLVSTMRTSGEISTGRGIVDRLLEQTRIEPHPGLQRQMALSLKSLPKSLLTRAQLNTRDTLLEKVNPSAPPYAKWFEGQAEPHLEVKQYVQDEFWRGEVASYKRMGFKVEVAADGKSAVAKKMLEDPKGKEPAVAATVTLVQKDSDVFADMDDKDLDIVIYTGHSGLGAVGKASAAMAPDMAGEKLVAMLACRTKQNLNALVRRFPGGHVLASKDGTYAHDDKNVIRELFDGIARRASYSDIRKSVERRANDQWVKDNYYFPHDERQLGWVDFDGDGMTAMSGRRPDLVYDPVMPRTKTEKVHMRPMREVPDLEGIDGQKVQDAVSWFSTLHFYWTEDFGSRAEKKQADQFRADGWFKSDNPDEIVRVEKVAVRGEEPVYRVKVNAAYSNQSADALGMMVTWALHENISKQNRPDESEYDRRMRGAAFVGSYASNLIEHGDDGDALMRQFAARFGFPPSLSFPLVSKAAAADYKHEASPKTIKYLERGMQYPFLEVNPNRTSLEFRKRIKEALDILKNSDTEIGRMTFEAICTGKVLVDELRDLNRPDFLRLRKEFSRDGIDIDIDAFNTLHDSRSKAYRAIKDNINGYMWDNRIYIADNIGAKQIATTLVHEVNHVLNKSEENYRGKLAVFVEEYRAFYSEAMFHGTVDLSDPDECRKIKEKVIHLYNLEGVSPDDVPDRPPGTFSLEGADLD